MAIEIVNFPIKHGDFPSFFVCLPEGNPRNRPSCEAGGDSLPLELAFGAAGSAGTGGELWLYHGVFWRLRPGMR